jgi:hypothetical protein
MPSSKRYRPSPPEIVGPPVAREGKQPWTVNIPNHPPRDFKLWVTDAQDQPAAVVPIMPRGSGDGRVQVVYSTPNTALNKQHVDAASRGEALILPPERHLANQAFAAQTGPIKA